MSSKEQLIWFKGSIVPVSEAKINVLSPTSQFGANVFEGLRAYWNDGQLYIFRLEEHVKRLQESIRMMRFNSNFSDDFLKKSLISTIRENEFKEDIAVRQTVFLDGFGSWASLDEVDMFIAPIAKGRQDPNVEGMSCTISSWERISERVMSPKVKMGANYMNSRLAQLEAKRNGYDTGIFLNNRGTVSEGPGSCLFMIKDGKVITPPCIASILDSITRATLITLISDNLGYQVVEREIDRSELYVADELFLAGTAVEVVHLKSIEKLTINNEKIGPVTQKIKDMYFDVVRGFNEDYKHWLTPVYE